MIGWAITFLVIALISGVLGFTGVSGAAANVAWIVFGVGLVLSIGFYLAPRY